MRKSQIATSNQPSPRVSAIIMACADARAVTSSRQGGHAHYPLSLIVLFAQVPHGKDTQCVARFDLE